MEIKSRKKTRSAMAEKDCTNSTNLHALAQLQARAHVHLGFIECPTEIFMQVGKSAR